MGRALHTERAGLVHDTTDCCTCGQRKRNSSSSSSAVCGHTTFSEAGTFPKASPCSRLCRTSRCAAAELHAHGHQSCQCAACARFSPGPKIATGMMACTCCRRSPYSFREHFPRFRKEGSKERHLMLLNCLEPTAPIHKAADLERNLYCTWKKSFMPSSLR